MKHLGVQKVLHYSENLSFQYHGQTLLHKIRSLRAALNRTIYKKSEKLQFWGYLTNISISLLNQLNNQQFMTCNSFSNYHLPEMRN